MSRRFAVVSSLALAAIVAIAIYSYLAIDRELTQAALSRRASLSYLAAATLNEKFDRSIDVGISLATRVRFRELIKSGEWAEASKILRDAPADFPFIERIGLVDLEGALVAGVPEVPVPGRQNFADRDWFQAVMRGAKPHMSQIFRRAASPQLNVFVAAVPIKNGKGAMLGVLVVQMTVARFFDWTRDIDVGPDGAIYVVDRRGTLAFHSHLPVHEKLIDFSTAHVVQRVLQGSRGVEVSFNPVENEERVAAFAPIGKYGWGVVVAQSSASVFATRNRLLGLTVIAFGLILAFFAAFVGTRVAMQRKKAEEERRLIAARERRAEEARQSAQKALDRHAERLRILHQIDRAIAAQKAPEAIAGAVIQPLRELLGVPRAVVNMFDLAAGEAEWLAAAGRRRVHVGSGVRYSIRMMGDLEALKRGEPQVIDTRALPPGPEVEALLASGVNAYMVVPMTAGGELIGALSFGGAQAEFPDEQIGIVQEVATQLAIAIAQARLLESVRRHAEELEQRVRERTSALEALNRDLDDLYNNAPGGYHSVGKDGLFVRMNDTELRWLGYAREEVIGKMGPRDLHTPDSLKIFEERFERFKETGVSRDVEYDFKRKDGTVLSVVLNATAVRDQQGHFMMSRSTLFDNTERKRAREEIVRLNAALERRAAELEAANQELESFSYSVSHDLRAPLRAIDGFSRIVQEDYAGKLDVEGLRLLGVIRDNSGKMGRLIDDLLEYSRLGRKPLSTAEIDMKRLVEDVLGELQASGGRSPRLDVGALPPARGDATLLKLAWTNLLANAIKFSGKREQPLVEVSGHENGAHCVYCVKDNGAGFDMRYHEKLFKVFQRLHREEEFEGTGVGLAIVQRVVSRHGGRVWAEGKVDEGAAFHFSLPKGGRDGEI